MTKEEKEGLIKMLNLALVNKGRVYVLRCEGKACDYYYVGWTRQLPHRLFQHFNGKGAAFTKLHKPLEVIDVIPGDKREEFEVYEKYRALYGDAVRGANDCSATGV